MVHSRVLVATYGVNPLLLVRSSRRWSVESIHCCTSAISSLAPARRLLTRLWLPPGISCWSTRVDSLRPVESVHCCSSAREDPCVCLRLPPVARCWSVESIHCCPSGGLSLAPASRSLLVHSCRLVAACGVNPLLLVRLYRLVGMSLAADGCLSPVCGINPLLYIRWLVSGSRQALVAGPLDVCSSRPVESIHFCTCALLDTCVCFWLSPDACRWSVESTHWLLPITGPLVWTSRQIDLSPGPPS